MHAINYFNRALTDNALIIASVSQVYLWRIGCHHQMSTFLNELTH